MVYFDIINIVERLSEGEEVNIKIEHNITFNHEKGKDNITDKYISSIASTLRSYIYKVNRFLPENIKLYVGNTCISIKSFDELKDFLTLSKILLLIYSKIGKIYNNIALEFLNLIPDCEESKVFYILDIIEKAGMSKLKYNFTLEKKYRKIKMLRVYTPNDLKMIYPWKDIYYQVNEESNTISFYPILFTDDYSREVFKFCYDGIWKILDIPPYVMVDPKDLFFKSKAYKKLKNENIEELTVEVYINDRYSTEDEDIEIMLSKNNKVNIDKFAEKLKDLLDCKVYVSIGGDSKSCIIRYAWYDDVKSDIYSLKKVLEELLLG